MKNEETNPFLKLTDEELAAKESELAAKVKEVRAEYERVYKEKQETENLRDLSMRAKMIRSGFAIGSFLMIGEYGYEINNVVGRVDQEGRWNQKAGDSYDIGVIELTKRGERAASRKSWQNGSDSWKEMSDVLAKIASGEARLYTPEEWANRKKTGTLVYQKSKDGKTWDEIAEEKLRDELRPHYFDTDMALKQIKKSVVRTPTHQYRAVKV